MHKPTLTSLPMKGKDHQRHRKIMNPAFSAAHLRTFLQLFQRVSGKVWPSLLQSRCPKLTPYDKLSDKWKDQLTATGELNIQLNRWLSRATLDVIGEGGSILLRQIFAAI